MNEKTMNEWIIVWNKQMKKKWIGRQTDKCHEKISMKTNYLLQFLWDWTESQSVRVTIGTVLQMPTNSVSSDFKISFIEHYKKKADTTRRGKTVNKQTERLQYRKKEKEEKINMYF